jgi:hypothetical protein
VAREEHFDEHEQAGERIPAGLRQAVEADRAIPGRAEVVEVARYEALRLGDVVEPGLGLPLFAGDLLRRERRLGRVERRDHCREDRLEALG